MKTYMKPSTTVVAIQGEQMLAVSDLQQSSSQASTTNNGNGEEYANSLVKGDAGMNIWDD
ncbi:MAG: hypothetical protein J5671_02950 [Bacteroidaceae bacterium]|nr:hypothetical protein [Bacteroidaceae bacterium]